jgi:hypothetical protein
MKIKRLYVIAIRDKIDKYTRQAYYSMHLMTVIKIFMVQV